jgi:F-type H+-transporting ATPase subunit a
MEEQILGVTKLINMLLGKPAAALLNVLHIQPENPDYPIPNHIAMELVVFLVAAVFFVWLRSRLSVERPGPAQQCLETLITNPMNLGVRDLLENMVGHGSAQYIPMLGSIGIFVLLCNLISLVPVFSSPTAVNSVPLGCAIVVFLYYNWCGVRKQGAFAYAKHFTGPSMPLPIPVNWIMSLLMLVIETVSHLARLLSLTVRLWVNMVVSELLYATFLGLTMLLFLYVKGLSAIGWTLAPVPLLVPPLFIVLHIFVGFVQAFVFTILPIIYVGGAVAEEH